MKADILNVKGEKAGKIDLPEQFSENYHPLIIMRAFNAALSQKYQHYGTDPRAGLRKVTELSKRRRKYRGVYGAGRSRTPKKVMSRSGLRFHYVADKAPQTRKGRVAHPPLVEKVFEEKINKKEKLLALRSAIAATIMKDVVSRRNHKIGNISLPLIVESAEILKKTKEVKGLLEKLGLTDELKRIKERKIRAGKGKNRGRKYKVKKGPLFVASSDCSLLKSAKGLLGVEAVPVKNLNVTLLAPGGKPGRLTIWTKEAVQEMGKDKLFTGENK